jgi:probable phosphoglycerate mutase
MAFPGDVLLFAHGHLLRVLTTELLGLPIETGRLLHLAPASIGILHETPWGDVLLERWNDEGPL